MIALQSIGWALAERTRVDELRGRGIAAEGEESSIWLGLEFVGIVNDFYRRDDHCNPQRC